MDKLIDDNFKIGEGLYLFNIKNLAEYEESLHSKLSLNEKIYLKFIKTQEGRFRYVMRKGLLRVLLGSYFNCIPSDIVFNYNVYGKPSVAFKENDIEFNISHSKEYMAVAISERKQVGVDIETESSFKKKKRSIMKIYIL